MKMSVAFHEFDASLMQSHNLWMCRYLSVIIMNMDYYVKYVALLMNGQGKWLGFAGNSYLADVIMHSIV